MTRTAIKVIHLVLAVAACTARGNAHDSPAQPSAPPPTQSAAGAGGCSGDGDCAPGYCDDHVCRAFRTEEEPCYAGRRCAAGLSCLPFPEPGDPARGLCVVEVKYAEVSATPDRFVGHLIGIRNVALLASVGACLNSMRWPHWCGCGGGPMYLSDTGRFVAPAREIVVPKYNCQWVGCYPKCPVPAEKRYRVAGRLGGRDHLTGLPNRELTIVAIQMLDETDQSAK